MTPLRKRMIEDMRLRNVANGTQRAYIYAIADFARFFQRSPAQLGSEEARRYLLHLVDERRLALRSLSASRFLYGVTLKQPLMLDELKFPRHKLKLPLILSSQKVRILLAPLRAV